MSLTRQFFREMRPLFRMLEEPFGRSPTYTSFPRTRLFEDPVFTSPALLRPAMDVTEEGNHYIVEAELPGVKKENVQVRIGDGGRSITIEGKVVDRRGVAPEGQSASSKAGPSGGETTQGAEGTKAVTTTPPEPREISSEREFVGSRTFTRTVWLPRRVDPNHVGAKLNDGVLTVTVPKAEDPGSVQIEVQ
ncbi:uncharacterized protein PHACADRAFT_261631 [Phanerochaete carnosa HHB-10118-sp]|uniref:SHSP domain-containing protein n=1 Tax=Phanerochaete carnosa (strain HHB-10118-sp) TaxID=650164 RepID=K5VJG7_PHACS|nr:uncharacterized protein PHACADRAFT_261631 [Phanerochaete carnosa HHB-10118-sp]EKM51483.1 hypothetical protein PHACADRAFT_261631 [Phanerochaete carnosa HHB-10118-sp]